MSGETLIAIAYVNLDEVDAAMSDIDERSKRMEPAFRKLRTPMRGDQREHAREAEGSGGKWPERAPATEERRKQHNLRVRRPKAFRTISPVKQLRRSTPKALLGRLPRAIRVTNGPLWVRATSFANFGYAHNRGAMVGHGRKVRLPQREFLWLSDALLDTCRDVMATYLVGGWKK